VPAEQLLLGAIGGLSGVALGKMNDNTEKEIILKERKWQELSKGYKVLYFPRHLTMY
jgi:hypothetical protein